MGHGGGSPLSGWSNYPHGQMKVAKATPNLPGDSFGHPQFYLFFLKKKIDFFKG
jgi:hypothetical protein